jgi:hypothetical protein
VTDTELLNSRTISIGGVTYTDVDLRAAIVRGLTPPPRRSSDKARLDALEHFDVYVGERILRSAVNPLGTLRQAIDVLLNIPPAERNDSRRVDVLSGEVIHVFRKGGRGLIFGRDPRARDSLRWYIDNSGIDIQVPSAST